MPSSQPEPPEGLGAHIQHFPAGKAKRGWRWGRCDFLSPDFVF